MSSESMNSSEPSKSKVVQTKVEPNTPSSDSVLWFFTDFKNDNVVTVCNKLLDLVKGFVNNFRNNYP
jgi:hypothetical protein